MNTETVLTLVLLERARQDRLKLEGKFRYTCADKELFPAEKLAVLAEEFGEVAKEVTEMVIADSCERGYKDGDLERLKKELVQVAAVCVAWSESLP